MMKKFISPEITAVDLTPAKTVMDDITASAEFPGIDNEQTVTDPAGNDEAVW